MPKKKFYAVKQGKITGIFTSWPECQDSVTGYPGAKFKGFPTEEEARAWLDGTAGAASSADSAISSADAEIGVSTKASSDAKTSLPANFSDNAREAASADDTSPQIKDLPDTADDTTLTAYVDGSFREDPGRYAYGCVFLLPDGRILRLSGCADDPDGVQIRNVAGEMRGAASAANFARANGFQNLKIYYDYAGIECWGTGSWKTNNPLTARYAAYMQSQAADVNISFHKVAAHTGDTWNEEADRLAREALTGEPGLANILLQPYADNKAAI